MMKYCLQKFIYKIATEGYYKLRQVTLLQIATGHVITNCDRSLY